MAGVIGSLPLPGVYKEKQLAAEAAYQQALAALAAEQRGTFNQFGFEGDVDEKSGAINSRINPNLQFGLVQQMLRGHSSGRTSLKENTSGRGLGKTGLAKQRQNLLKFLQQGDVAGLGQRFHGAIGNIQKERGNARRMRDQEFTQAELEAMQYAMANGLFNSAGAAEGSTSGGAGAGSTPLQTGYDPVSNADWARVPGAGRHVDTQNYDPVAAQEEIARAMANAGASQAYDPLQQFRQPRGRQQV